VRAPSSFAINSISTLAGTTIGSRFTPIGIIKGGIIGAIIGSIVSYLVENKLIDPYFFKKKDYLSRAYKAINLELFEKNHKRAFT